MFFPSVAGGSHRRLPGTVGPLVYGASFTNPKPVHKIWRSGDALSGTIAVPTGYSSVTWQIIQHQTFAVEKSGSGLTVSHTFTYKGTDKVNTFALLINATKSGKPDLWWLSPGEFTCLPQKPVSWNETWDLSSTGTGFHNGGWTDHPTGWTIRVIGAHSGSNKLGEFYYRSSDPLHPVHVVFDNCSITTNVVGTAFSPGSSQNIIFDGCTDEAVQYGLSITRTAGANGENVYCTPSDSTHESYNWVMCGMHVDNGVFTQGGTGFVMQMTNNVTFNANTYTFTQLTVFNMLMENCKNEAYYVGHTRDTDVPPFCKISNALYYRCNSNHSRNEGFQVGGHITSELFKCNWQDTGLGNEAGQMNNMQVNPGCQGMTVYMNQGLTARDLHQGFMGNTGTGVEIFSNVLETTGSGFVVWLCQMWDDVATPPYQWSNHGNTIITPDGICFSFYNKNNPSNGTFFNPHFNDANVIVSSTPNTNSNYQHFNGFVTTNVIMNNLYYTDINTPGFTSVVGKDYRPASLSSPLFGFTQNTTSGGRRHAWAQYDFDGYKRNPLNVCCGAFSGFPLMTQ